MLAVSRHRRPRAILVMALVALCILLRPLLAIACDLHDAAHGAAQPQIEAAAGGTTGEENPSDLVLHALHCCLHTIALPTALPAVAPPVPALGIPPLRPLRLADRQPADPLRPPISA